jgi:hypothetical protein
VSQCEVHCTLLEIYLYAHLKHTARAPDLSLDHERLQTQPNHQFHKSSLTQACEHKKGVTNPQHDRLTAQRKPNRWMSLARLEVLKEILKVKVLNIQGIETPH